MEKESLPLPNIKKLQRIGERSERIKEVLSYEFKDAENEKTMESLVTLLELTVSADKGGTACFFCKCRCE